MTDIRIRKGHNIKISGAPKPEIITGERPAKVALVPVEFRYVKPKLLVKEGDVVQLGAPLFFDKRNPQVRWASPGGGTVSKIQFGPRRVIEKVVVALDREEETFTVPVYDQDSLSSLDRGRIIETLLKASLWPLIRQRPFNKIANPDDKPKAIFVSGLNTAPLTVDLDLALEGQERSFQAGLTVLNQLTDGAVHLTIPSKSRQPALTGAENVVLHRISGPHPAGNVGIQIHHIDPINPGDVVWTVTAQQVVILGKLFLTGRFDPTIIVSVGGPSVKNPIHVRTRMGVALETLLSDQLKEGDHRILSGDVLTGRKAGIDGYLGFYDTTVSAIPVNKQRPFLGWLRLGSKKTIYTLTRAYAAFGHERFDFTTKKNGSARALVPINAWEEVLPMDILPNPLYRSILARDVEEMEKLGILECDEEDFALCTFACPSKINLGRAIRQGLDLMEKEI